MDWLADVQSRIKRGNKVLFATDSEFLEDLAALIKKQNHRTLALWALELADEATQTLQERYPHEKRFKIAVQTSRDWARGKVKMREAQRSILNVHAVAKEIESPEDIALCHAIGQACGVVHTVGHALGFPIYELTALVRHYGVLSCKPFVEKRKQYYIERIHHWHKHYHDHSYEWAEFMMKD